jgi:hypothetical protein
MPGFRHVSVRQIPFVVRVIGMTFVLAKWNLKAAVSAVAGRTSAPATAGPVPVARMIIHAAGPMTTSAIANRPAPGIPATAVAVPPVGTGHAMWTKTATPALMIAAGAAAMATAAPRMVRPAATILPWPGASAKQTSTAAKLSGMTSASGRSNLRDVVAATAADRFAETANAKPERLATIARTTAAPAAALEVAAWCKRLKAATTPQSRPACVLKTPSVANSSGTASASMKWPISAAATATWVAAATASVGTTRAASHVLEIVANVQAQDAAHPTLSRAVMTLQLKPASVSRTPSAAKSSGTKSAPTK